MTSIPGVVDPRVFLLALSVRRCEGGGGRGPLVAELQSPPVSTSDAQCQTDGERAKVSPCLMMELSLVVGRTVGCTVRAASHPTRPLHSRPLSPIMPCLCVHFMGKGGLLTWTYSEESADGVPD